MKAVIIGAGLIGCGFAGQLLHASGYQIVFAARRPAMVEHLNRANRYRVRLVDGVETHEVLVEGVRAVCASAPEQAAKEMAEADLIVTAVGAGNLPNVAPLIAAGLQQRAAPVNVLACENLNKAGSYLRELVARNLPPYFPLAQHGFAGTLVDRAVPRRLGEPAQDELLTFIGEPSNLFVVEGRSLRAPLPPLEGMIIAEDFPAWIQRKLFIFSAGHATCAYLGYLKGYHYIHTAIRDAEIRGAVLAAMREGQRGLAARLGRSMAGNENDLRQIIARFENAALNDPIMRVGRDPKRKLGAEDRLVGAARLAEKAGIRPEKLALAAAAALCFYNPADPSAVDLHREIDAAGLEPALRHICGLDPQNGFGHFVAEVWSQLADGCWQKGNLLLSLKQLLWAWR